MIFERNFAGEEKKVFTVEMFDVGGLSSDSVLRD